MDESSSGVFQRDPVRTVSELETLVTNKVPQKNSLFHIWSTEKFSGDAKFHAKLWELLMSDCKNRIFN